MGRTGLLSASARGNPHNTVEDYLSGQESCFLRVVVSHLVLTGNLVITRKIYATSLVCWSWGRTTPIFFVVPLTAVHLTMAIIHRTAMCDKHIGNKEHERWPSNQPHLWSDGVQKTALLPQKTQHLPVLIHQCRHSNVGPSTTCATAAYGRGQLAPSLPWHPPTAHRFDSFQRGTAVSFDDARGKLLECHAALCGSERVPGRGADAMRLMLQAVWNDDTCPPRERQGERSLLGPLISSTQGRSRE